MDVLEYEKARIRMCRTMILKEGGCEACPLFNGLKRRCGFAASIAENMDENAIRKNIDIVIKWSKDHPVKTRQREFLKLFPNADMQRINTLFPCVMDQTIRPARCVKYEMFSSPRKCVECRKDYWNEEVSDND